MRPSLRMGYGILGAPAAFMLLEMLGWLLAAATCPRGGSPPVLGSARGLLVAIDLLALVMCLAALRIGILEWRRSSDAALTAIRGEQRTDFLAAAAMLVSSVFTVSVLLMSIPIYTLPLCQVMR